METWEQRALEIFERGACLHPLARETRYVRHYWNDKPRPFHISCNKVDVKFIVQECDFCKSQLLRMYVVRRGEFHGSIYFEPIFIYKG